MEENWREAKPPESDFDLVPAVVDPKDDRKFGYGRSKRGSRSKKAGGGRGRHRANKKNSGRGKARERNTTSMPERIRNKKQPITSSNADAPSSCAAPGTNQSDGPILDSEPLQDVDSMDVPEGNLDELNFKNDPYYGQPEFYPEMNFIPPQPPVFLNPETVKKRAAEQLNYYFSVENLCKDVYLRRFMDVEGYIPLSIVGQFKRMQQITLQQMQSFDLVLELLRDIAHEADQLDFDVANDKVRLTENWKAWLLPNENGTRGVPLWTKLPEEGLIGSNEEVLDGKDTEVILTPSSKPFVPNVSAEPFVPSTSS